MKRIWIILLALVVLAFLAYKYVYQDHRDIEKEHPDHFVTSISIISEFSSNSADAEKKYLNKTIEVHGTITEIGKSEVTLDDNVFSQFSEGIATELKINDKIKIKGRCIGYDDLLEQIKLDQCIIIK